MSFHKKVILGVVGLVAVALALIFIIRDSDEELIENLIRDAAKAAENRDSEGVIAHVSKHYQNGGEDYSVVCKRIREAVAQRVGLLEVAGSAITIDGENAEAMTRVKVIAGTRLLGEFGLKLKLKKEEGTWKVTSAEEIR